MDGAPVVKAQALICPNCGGQVQLRGFAHTLVVVCDHCGAVLDSSTPLLRVLKQAQEATKQPLLPLGSRGPLYGTNYEAIGYQIRGIVVDGEHYCWSEYVLFNPYKGFLYLTEYDGHWNVVRTVTALPAGGKSGRKPTQELAGRTYTHFQHALAKTEYVLGEFPWRVQVGEQVAVDDYIDPPRVLSGEGTGKEITWSLGEYWTGAEIWRTFQLPGSPPPAIGIYENQPSPAEGRPREVRRLCGYFLLALLAVAIYFAFTERGNVVLNEARTYQSGAAGSAAFVTSMFDLKGHPSSVQIQTRTDLDNNWLYFDYALINNGTGQAYEVGREVSYYYGQDSDGAWTEGSRNDSVTIPAVPPGTYYLRVEPETDTKSSTVNYQIVVRRDVPSYLLLILAAIALILPAIFVGWRSHMFEYRRWQESDYASGSSGGDD
jgi:Domain of unknown function (DUF4178)